MSIIIGTNASETINGTNQGDIIIAGNGNDTVNGGNGNDIITGGNANDVLNGDAGNDIINGGNGTDTINGGSGTDILLGGNGDDTLDGGSSSDILLGGNGKDVLIYRASENVNAVDIYDGGNGQDTLRLVVSQAMANSAAFQADIAALQAKLSHGSASYIFSSMDLVVTSIEQLQVIVEGGSTNHAPVAVADTVAATEDASVTILASSLLTNDTDADSGDTKTLVSVQGAQHGTVSLNSSGDVVFVADANYSGVASFTYTMKDTAGATSTATVTVNVVAVNDAPVAAPVNLGTVAEDGSVTITAAQILAGVSDVDGPSATVTSFTLSSGNGALVDNGNGTWTYTPAADDDTAASFAYTVSDGLLSASSTASLDITPVNDAPVAAPVNLGTVAEDGSVTITAAQILAGVSDVDGPSATVTSFTLSSGNGALVDNGNGTWTYTPAADDDTAASFAYTVSDGLLSASSTASLDITPVSDAPVAVADTVAATEDVPVTILASSLLANDTDVDVGDSKTLVSVQGAQNGTVSLDSSGDVVFVADANFSGVASFTYTMKDNAGATSTATATVNVAAVADAPTVSTPAASGTTDAPISLNIGIAPGDPSETPGAVVEIQDVPSSFTLNHGSPTDDGGWLVQVSDLADLKLVPVAGSATPGTFTLHVTATSVDGTSTATTTAALSVTVDPGATQHAGRVVDGYIVGATVFADADGDGLLDTGEAFTTTAADGTFVLTGGTGSLVMFGGTDVSTGVAFSGTMKAPEGSTVVTPLTTLVAELVASTAGSGNPLSAAAAQDAVAAAFGFDPSIDLQTYDPVPGAISGNDPTATAVLSAAIQVQSTVSQMSAVAGATADVIGAIATTITAASGGAVDLSDFATVTAIATDSGVPAAALTAVTNVVTAAVGSIQSATDVTELAQAATVAQGDATAALAATNFSDANAVTQLTDTFVGDLVNQVAAADVGDVDGPLLGTLGGDVLTGTGGIDAIDGLDGDDTIDGAAGNDLLYGGAGRDNLTGGTGDDAIDGGEGSDRAVYTNATAGIDVQLAAGIVTGDASVGTDTLRGVEGIVGTGFNDVFNAASFTATSTNGGGNGIFIAGGNGPQGSFNEFEGMGGNDTVTGNFNTRISYQHADAAVTVNLGTHTASGTALGDLANVGTDNLVGGIGQVRGSSFDDTLTGSANGAAHAESFEGWSGNDVIDGNGGFDRVRYDNQNTGALGITVNLGNGTVTGRDAAATAVVGTDTLRSIESVRGSNAADIFDASTFTATSTNGGGNGDQGNFNEFEGMGGNDTITGNGNTRITYVNSTGAVAVTMSSPGAGTAAGDGSVGTDTFSNVTAVRGSNFNDTLTGSANAANTTENFEGWNGDDLINGGGGFDRARYDNNSAGSSGIPLTLGVNIDMTNGVVTGRDVYAASVFGTDTLRRIESVRGTSADDVYVATGFGAGGLNVGDNGTFNEFEGMAGNDTITGNGNTRITFVAATEGVTVNLTTGSVVGGASVGTDTITGDVFYVRGSGFADTIAGTNSNDRFEGQGGDDIINGGGGNDTILGENGNDTLNGGSNNDTLTGGAGADTFVYAAGSGADTITDFSHAQGDKIDLSGVPGMWDLAHVLAGQNPAGTVLNFGSGNTLTLTGVTVGSLTAGDFVFTANQPPSVTLANVVASLPEDVSTVAATRIADIVVADDGFGTNTLSLSGADAASFEIIGNSLYLKAGATLNYEALAALNVTVSVDDATVGGSPDASAPFTLAITDVNETPDDIALSANSVAENSTNSTVVGTLSATDPDFGDTVTLSLTDDAGGLFAIIGGNLVVNGALDYESAISHQVTVRATDLGGLYREETYTIDVTDVPGQIITGTTGVDTLIGTTEADTISALAGDDAITGGDGNDAIDGGDGNDRAIYSAATGGLTINLAAGTVSGAGVGSDTLNAVEMIRGSNFADTFDATGVGPTSTNAASVFFQNSDGKFNEFEGMGGDDIITGNGSTRISYLNAASGVTVNIVGNGSGTGTSTGANDAAGVGTDNFTGVSAVRGSNFADILTGGTVATSPQNFEGRGGADSINGGIGFDRSVYTFESAAISVTLKTGTVNGGDGTDTLLSIEGVRGTASADTYDATGFIATNANGPNFGSAGTNNAGSALNEFEGMGGNDIITGNGNTRIAFYNATSGVTVNLGLGTASGDASVGSDTFTAVNAAGTAGVNAVAGSWFDDALTGSNNDTTSTHPAEVFDGRNGNDTINGLSGFDQAVYNNDPSVTAGISVSVSGVGNVNFTVTGGTGVGTDTLTAIESIRGTNFADTFNAENYAGSSTDNGRASSFNEFEGMGGNDSITGNGNTRISYVSATAGVTVDIAAGTASGTAVGDAAGVGNDGFTGVSRVRGSNSDDIIRGGSGNNTLEGQNGNDLLEGRSGADTLTGGNGNDTFQFNDAAHSAPGTGTFDTITDFKISGTDIIDLIGIDANTANGGDDGFSYGGQNSAIVANTVTWFQSGGNTIVQADIDGNLVADFTVTLTGLKTLTQSDFLL